MPHYLFGIGCIVVLAVGWCIHKLNQKLRVERLEANSKLALERAKAIGPILYFNTIQGTTAVCRADDLKKSNEKYLQEIASKKRKAWDILQFRVNPTFTFYNEPQYQNLIQAGSTGDFEKLRIPIVEQVIGFKKRDILDVDENENPNQPDFKRVPKHIRDEFKNILNTLIVENKQLFVPFANGKRSNEENFYDKAYTFEEVKKHIFKDLPSQDGYRLVV